MGTDSNDMARQAARWLAEAWESGDPLAPLPPGMAPVDAEAAEAVAAGLVGTLGLKVAGLRLAPAPGGGWLAAPLPDARLLRAGTALALSGLRHPRLSVGVLGVLGEPLGEGAPVFAALHPVLDVAATRFSEPPADVFQALADLGGVGLAVLGKRFTGPLPERVEVRLGPTGTRPRPFVVELATPMAAAAAAARRWGEWPAGSVLLVAGLAQGGTPRPGEKWSAAAQPVGRITVGFA